MQNHPVPDGNKRTAFLCMVEFIERNNGELQLRAGDTAESVADVLVDLAAHTISEREFAHWIDERIRP